MQIMNRILFIAKTTRNARRLTINSSVGIRKEEDGILKENAFVIHSSNFDNECPEILRSAFLKDFLLFDSFVTTEEENCFLESIRKPLARLKYEYDHWDGVICGYREIEKSSWEPRSSNVLNRIQATAFDEKAVMLPAVHVLDLCSDGFIKPHVDSKFCGRRIAGISLLSSAIMRLKPKDVAKDQIYVDVLLKPRSLYIMRDYARYELTHEILADEESYFKGDKVNRERRISIVMREEPPS